MSANPTWEGLGQGMLVLAAVWWAWGGYAWLTNALHSDDGLARVAAVRGDGGDAGRRAGGPGGVRRRRAALRLAYFAVRAIHIVVYAYGARTSTLRGAIRRSPRACSRRRR